MQFKKSELLNPIKEEVTNKKRLEELQTKKAQLSEEYRKALQECGISGEMEECDIMELGMQEHGDGIGLGVNHLVDEDNSNTTYDINNLDYKNLNLETVMSEPFKTEYVNTYGEQAYTVLIDFIKADDSSISEEERFSESKPSAGLSAKKRSAVVKAAKSGKDIGKKGKGFKDVEAKAKASGATDPKAVAAAAMWKNIKR